MSEPKAKRLAEKNQGILCKIDHLALKRMEMREGLELLKKARAVTILAHPAVDNSRIGFDEFDQKVLFPLIDIGLDGIEVFYPYDPYYRENAFRHYAAIAKKNGMLVSGGTDSVIQTLPPITERAPMTVSPPRIVAPEYIITSFSIVGWRFFPLSRSPASLGSERAPKVTP